MEEQPFVSNFDISASVLSLGFTDRDCTPPNYRPKAIKKQKEEEKPQYEEPQGNWF